MDWSFFLLNINYWQNVSQKEVAKSYSTTCIADVYTCPCEGEIYYIIFLLCTFAELHINRKREWDRKDTQCYSSPFVCRTQKSSCLHAIDLIEIRQIIYATDNNNIYYNKQKMVYKEKKISEGFSAMNQNENNYLKSQMTNNFHFVMKPNHFDYKLHWFTSSMHNSIFPYPLPNIFISWDTNGWNWHYHKYWKCVLSS